ncbi:MAG TPA: hypothetical protein VN372_04805 [Methanospirillum sp.]|nr:hypothetical protein [Methanospirillum sp.]
MLAFHQSFLKGEIVIIFCPKLDAAIEGYIEKLADIISLHTITLQGQVIPADDTK